MRSTRLIGVTLAAFLATSLGGAASAADMAGGCSIEVAQMEDEYRREYITGMSVLADVSSSRRPDSFAELSCLERLMNSVMDVFFEPPGLPDLLGELENFIRSEEHTSELQSLMRISYAVFCLKKKKHKKQS